VKRKRKVLGRKIIQCHFVHHKSHITCAGIEPGPLRWKPATRLLYYGKAQTKYGRTLEITEDANRSMMPPPPQLYFHSTHLVRFVASVQTADRHVLLPDGSCVPLSRTKISFHSNATSPSVHLRSSGPDRGGLVEGWVGRWVALILPHSS
jgi:hypothetical protein